MNATVDFYLQRAADSADAASKTDLVNVRERCLRAEAAWRAMAERLILVEEKKKRDALAKATVVSSEPLEVPWPIAPYKRPARPTG